MGSNTVIFAVNLNQPDWRKSPQQQVIVTRVETVAPTITDGTGAIVSDRARPDAESRHNARRKTHQARQHVSMGEGFNHRFGYRIRLKDPAGRRPTPVPLRRTGRRGGHHLHPREAQRDRSVGRCPVSRDSTPNSCFRPAAPRRSLHLIQKPETTAQLRDGSDKPVRQDPREEDRLVAFQRCPSNHG